MITPVSEQVRATIERDGLLADLEAIGATVLANACGPCIGQWQRDDIAKGTPNTIVSSFNRNFPARNDGNPSTLSFIGSPETVTAMALTGRLDIDFVRHGVPGPDGEDILLEPPSADELPAKGFDPGESGFVAPAPVGNDVQVVVKPGSDRLELLEPFAAWDGNDFTGLQVLMNLLHRGACGCEAATGDGAGILIQMPDRFLRKVAPAPLLSALSKPGARALIGVMSARAVPAGTVIIEIGEPATAGGGGGGVGSVAVISTSSRSISPSQATIWRW